MKHDHRHELKANELAEWIANLPQWFRENMTSVITVGAVVVVVGALYLGLFYRKNMALQRQSTRLTSMITQLPFQEMEIARANAQGKDQSFVLMAAAKTLEGFAQSTKNDQMAALALIEQAEVLRAELRYRLGDISKTDLLEQVGLVKASYTEALRRAASNHSLAANAKYGLGLCEEDLGNFDEAEKIYREVVGNPAYEGTAAKAAAEYRLKTMSDYKTAVVFKPAPVAVTVPTSAGPVVGPRVSSVEPKKVVKVKPADANLPAVPIKQKDVNLPAGGPKPDANQTAQTPVTTTTTEANQPTRR